MKKSIVLTIAGTDYNFNVNVQNHSDIMDSMVRGESMTATSHNFLMRTIDDKQKEQLKTLLAGSPGAEITIATMVKTEFAPTLEITVKK